MTNLKKVVAIQDDAGHWYVIPAEFKQEFCKLLDCDEDDVDLQKEFTERFSQYATGGDLNLVQLYAEIE